MAAPNLICTSVRGRPHFVDLVPSLTKIQGTARWKETKLGSHDVAIPLPRNVNGSRQSMLHVILLAADDLDDPNLQGRIDRLYHLGGGRHAAIVFLLKAIGHRQNSTASLMELQLKMGDRPGAPILPSHSIEAVVPALMNLARHLQHEITVSKPPHPAISLLPFCGQSQARPMPEHTVNVLTDLTSGFRSLLDQVSDPDKVAEMAGFIGVDSAQISSFWMRDSNAE